MAYGLNNFPIPDRILNEILYDYIDVNIKPEFSIIFYTEKIDDEKINLIRIDCLKCCGIKSNPRFEVSGVERPWIKRTNYIKLFSTHHIEDEIKKATYFEIKDKNRIIKDHYDFAQLSNREKFFIINIVFEENRAHIPETFYNCMVGLCQLE